MNESNLLLGFPTETNRKFSPGGLAYVEKLMKINPLLALSHLPSPINGDAMFDPELNDVLMDRYGLRLTPAEKQREINNAWAGKVE